jgi:hypothetical protein
MVFSTAVPTAMQLEIAGDNDSGVRVLLGFLRSTADDDRNIGTND